MPWLGLDDVENKTAFMSIISQHDDRIYVTHNVSVWQICENHFSQGRLARICE